MRLSLASDQLAFHLRPGLGEWKRYSIRRNLMTASTPTYRGKPRFAAEQADLQP